MRLASLPVTLATATAVTVGLSGCGSPRDEVRAKVQQFAQAAAAHDYATICSQVLAPALVNRLVESGIPCRAAVRVALGGVRNATLAVGSIAVHGRTASAVTLSGARGQQSALSTVELVRTRAGWRITALSSPGSSTR